MTRIAALALTLVVTGGCAGDKVGGPSGPKESVSLEMCSDFRPNWMAIQNEGEAWQAITVPATGPITFDATPQVSVAMALSFFGFGGFTTVFNVARDEIDAAPVFLDCEGFAFGDRELNGTVAGLVDDDYAGISASSAYTNAGVESPAWSLPSLPNQSLDLVATRVSDPFLQTVDRVIVRRGLLPGLPGSAPIPVLDFAAAEAKALAATTLTLSNVGNDVVDVTNTFTTANGTTHPLTSSFSPGATHPVYSVPSELTVAGDLHALSVTAFTDQQQGFRDATHYYRTAGNKSLTLGAFVGIPTITTVTSSPTKRMRAQLASQSDYPDGVAVAFSQGTNCGEGCFTIYVVSVLTTAAFLGGTPATWELTIPDLSAAGYQASWGLQNNATPVEWDVTALGGGSSAALGTPVEGATITSSSRSSSAGLAAAAFSGARSFRRPLARRR
jgi:hypothetical protein